MSPCLCTSVGLTLRWTVAQIITMSRLRYHQANFCDGIVITWTVHLTASLLV